MPVKSRANEIHIVRTYDAPVAAVWDAWTDPDQVAQWWGPRGFTLTTHSKDFRVGGVWKYTMHGPDGTDYPNVTPYLEIEKHKKLVYDHGGSEDRPPMFRVTVVFSESDGKTTMDMTMSLATPEALEETRKIIKKFGGNSTWDRLAEYLTTELKGEEKFFINRSFEAPIEIVFQMWTDPVHLAQWLPPTGFTMKFTAADIKPGGSMSYSMTGENGMKMYGRANYIEIVKPNRIVYMQEFCDEHGNIARHPMSPTWPKTMLTIIMLN